MNELKEQRGEAAGMREPGEEHVARPLGRAGKGGRFCRLYGGELFREALR